MIQTGLPERAAEMLKRLFTGHLAEAGVNAKLEQLTPDELQEVWRAADRLATLAARAKRRGTNP